MNDRLAEGLRKQTSMTNYCGEGELSERIFCGYFEEIFKKEERTGIEIKQKILEFRPSVVRHAVCCNPGALGHSALSSCGAAVYFNNSPAFAGNVNADPASNPDYRGNTPNDQKFALCYGQGMQSMFSNTYNSATGTYNFMDEAGINKKIEAYKEYMK